ncbi:hypothetical protein EHQ81_19420 [Leptospira selangorensis]|uniref:Uncharacterized protein n=1 Tax=Leptospira selangorensis TaxID=2484982 RepID=A0A5F2C6G4_9LEPT|nr:hypothetical protein [Leptospira selangorensis]TGM10278.1 hypothetical protein EHQ81_19420 [Leptospira selangorensis]TGM27940.1 hypothetical protein EHQ82_01600 [Leptospira selangorensis]
MAIYKKDFHKKIKSTIDTLRKKFLNENKRLSKIVQGDDWSFMIKSLAILESIVLRLLVTKTNDARFEKFYSRISLSQKADLLVDLELVTKQQRKFISFLSKIRNNLAHNPDEINFNLKKYLKSLSANELNQLPNLISVSENDKHKLSLNYIKRNPKNAIWVTLFTLLSLLIAETEMIETRRELDKLAIHTSEELLKDIAPEIFVS